MTKRGAASANRPDEIARFKTARNQRNLFHHYLNSATKLPVLMFYGIGGAGKTWLLKKLRQETPADVPAAYLDFDRQAGGQRFVLDPAAALYEIRQQIGREAPRFDLAFAMLRHKQARGGAGFAGKRRSGAGDGNCGRLWPSRRNRSGRECAAEQTEAQLLARIKGSSFERFLARGEADQFVLELRAKTSQEIGADLLQ